MLVDDDPMVRAGVRSILERDPAIVVVAEASDGDEVVAAHHAHHPDIVIMDMSMERVSGNEAIRELARQIAPPRCIAFTSLQPDRYVFDALESGAVGFLLKDIAPADLRAAMHTVMRGDMILSPRATRLLVERHAHDPGQARQAEAVAAASILSSRERQVAWGVWQGWSNAQIARRLGLTEATVKTHLSHVMTKVDATSRVQVALVVERAQGSINFAAPLGPPGTPS